MKPNEQQKEWLSDYLRQVLAYSETYEEVYDHILLALENRPEQQFFETVVNQIIEEDFGGSNGLMTLEENYKNGTASSIKKRYRSYFTRWFKFPAIIGAVVFFIITYITTYVCIFFNWRYSNVILILSILAVIMPVCIIFITRIRNGNLFGGYYRESSNYRPIKNIALKPFKYLFYLLTFETLVNSIAPFFLKPAMYRSMVVFPEHIFWAIICMLSVTHLVAFCKIYKEEFISNMISAK